MRSDFYDYTPRWINVKITPAEAKKINHQIRAIALRDRNHRLKHHLHVQRVPTCPDCPDSEE